MILYEFVMAKLQLFWNYTAKFCFANQKRSDNAFWYRFSQSNYFQAT